MVEVVSVRFKSKGKVYYFDPSGITVEKGAPVIVETSKGLEYAECTRGNHEVEDNAVVQPLRPVIRLATQEDTEKSVDNRRREEEALKICNEKIAKHGLDMKLVDVEYNFEGTKILFFFTSDGRVDFRDLVKDLASIFRTRIELRQIGVRDEARMLNGLGICGRPFCCAQFLDDFQPVSIKMAKTQGLSLNPTKISGTCGRLMCCLKYEQDAYEELVKLVPKVDSFVETPQGKGMVTDVNLLRSRVRVRLEDQSDTTLKMFDAGDVHVLGGKAARSEYLATRAEQRAKEEPRPVKIRSGITAPRPTIEKITLEEMNLPPAYETDEEAKKYQHGGIAPRKDNSRTEFSRREQKWEPKNGEKPRQNNAPRPAKEGQGSGEGVKQFGEEKAGTGGRQNQFRKNNYRPGGQRLPEGENQKQGAPYLNGQEGQPRQGEQKAKQPGQQAPQPPKQGDGEKKRPFRPRRYRPKGPKAPGGEKPKE